MSVIDRLIAAVWREMPDLVEVRGAMFDHENTIGILATLANGMRTTARIRNQGDETDVEGWARRIAESSQAGHHLISPVQTPQWSLPTIYCVIAGGAPRAPICAQP